MIKQEDLLGKANEGTLQTKLNYGMALRELGRFKEA